MGKELVSKLPLAVWTRTLRRRGSIQLPTSLYTNEKIETRIEVVVIDSIIG